LRLRAQIADNFRRIVFLCVDTWAYYHHNYDYSKDAVSSLMCWRPRRLSGSPIP